MWTLQNKWNEENYTKIHCWYDSLIQNHHLIRSFCDYSRKYWHTTESLMSDLMMCGMFFILFWFRSIAVNWSNAMILIHREYSHFIAYECKRFRLCPIWQLISLFWMHKNWYEEYTMRVLQKIKQAESIE